LVNYGNTDDDEDEAPNITNYRNGREDKINMLTRGYGEIEHKSRHLTSKIERGGHFQHSSYIREWMKMIKKTPQSQLARKQSQKWKAKEKRDSTVSRRESFWPVLVSEYVRKPINFAREDSKREVEQSSSELNLLGSQIFI
jgi:hypothetical protein